MILDEDLCEKRGESNNNGFREMGDNRGNFANKQVMIDPGKNCTFCWQIDQCVSFKMPLELSQAEVCGKSYDCFTETVQDGSKN